VDGLDQVGWRWHQAYSALVDRRASLHQPLVVDLNHKPAIARLEAGRVAPSLDSLQRVAAALGVELVVAFADAQPQRHDQAPVVG